MNRPIAKVKSAETAMFLADIFICGSMGDENLKSGQVYKVLSGYAICFGIA